MMANQSLVSPPLEGFQYPSPTATIASSFSSFPKLTFVKITLYKSQINNWMSWQMCMSRLKQDKVTWISSWKKQISQPWLPSCTEPCSVSSVTTRQTSSSTIVKFFYAPLSWDKFPLLGPNSECETQIPELFATWWNIARRGEWSNLSGPYLFLFHCIKNERLIPGISLKSTWLNCKDKWGQAIEFS